MRGIIEQFVARSVTDEIKIVDEMMRAASRLLLIALGFKQSHLWTLCVYKAVNDPQTNGVNLVCVAKNRAIDCDITEARIWPAGIGTVGMAYANAREIIVPDMQAVELGSTYDLGDMARADDKGRYRSIATVPILVAGGNKPWGVVVATSDQPHHFYVDEETGVRTSEAVRSLASMVALAVVVCKPEVGPINLKTLPKSGTKVVKKR